MPRDAALPPSSRNKILDVSEALFAQRGFAGVGMREVAEAAGLGKSSLFHHFRSKAQLYYEVLGRELERIRGRLDAALTREAPPRARLESWVDALVDALAEHPTSARLLLRALFEDHDLSEPLPEADQAERVLGGILQQIHRLLGEGVESGAFRRVAVPDTVQTLIGATVYHFASGDLGESVLGAPVFSAESVRRRKRELVGLLERGIVAAAEPHSEES
jgi:AcrR family transcriptional regulator